MNDKSVDKIMLRTVYGFKNSVVLLFMTLIIGIYSQLLQESIYFILIYLTSMFLIITSELLINFALKIENKIKSDYIRNNKEILFLGRILGYVLILILFLTEKIGSPLQFLIPIVASLDYYLIISFWLWISIFCSIKQFLNQFQILKSEQLE